MAISRTREYDADEDGATSPVTRWRWPPRSASSSRHPRSGRCRPSATSSTRSALMIANPFRGDGLSRMFSTHPPMAERIARLEAMAGYRR